MDPDRSHTIRTRGEQLDAWLALTGQTAAAGPVRLPLLTGSMAPALPPQSTLLIDPCPPAEFRRGDVIVFTEEDRLVAHRVLLRLRLPGLDWILEKGDANPRGSWLTARRVTGVVRDATRPDGTGCDPRCPATAGRSLRRHLRAWLTRVSFTSNGES